MTTRSVGYVKQLMECGAAQLSYLRAKQILETHLPLLKMLSKSGGGVLSTRVRTQIEAAVNVVEDSAQKSSGNVELVEEINSLLDSVF